jgi:hypothetical protein
MNQTLVPADFAVPVSLRTASFRLRMLTVNDVVKDYDAVMTSIDHLRGLFGKGSTWPSPELSIEQDLIDLGWHQKEFQKHSSFAYTMMSLDEKLCLGCVYIYPTSEAGYDAEVYFWARQSHLELGLERALFDSMKSWLKREWPFKKVCYPGRNEASGKRV